VFDPKHSADPDAYLGRMAARFPDLHVRTRAEGGEPAGRICAVAKEEGADMIVVGNRGISGRQARLPAERAGSGRQALPVLGADRRHPGRPLRRERFALWRLTSGVVHTGRGPAI